jgi:hypothetical protein
MSGDPLTNGQRAALAMAAVSLYARSSPAEHPAETAFFFDFERDALPGGDQDRLSGLLCGLLHYAERRNLSFNDALTAARQEYARQRTTYLPGNAVRRAGPRWRTPAAGDLPLTGEVISARPGHPARYLIDFITGTEWLPETALEPAEPFPLVTVSSSAFASAYIARHALERAVRAIETSHADGRAPDDSLVTDAVTILAALSDWSGIGRKALLQAFGEVVTEKDGLLIAGGRSSHPVTLAAVGAPPSPVPALDGPPAVADHGTDVLPFRNPARRSRAGRP